MLILPNETLKLGWSIGQLGWGLRKYLLGIRLVHVISLRFASLIQLVPLHKWSRDGIKFLKLERFQNTSKTFYRCKTFLNLRFPCLLLIEILMNVRSKLSWNFEAMFRSMAGLEYSEILPTFRQVQQFVKIFSGNKSILTKWNLFFILAK